MDLNSRVERYKTIEAARSRPLIVYATSTRPGVKAMMAGDAVREFIDQIDAIHDSNRVDVLIHSTGGDALAAWKLMSVLRERFEHVSVLVPYMAFSAATIFAMGADEIVMHPHASLGPIDPQISIPLPEGNQRHFSYEDVGAFLRFLEKDVEISEQVHIAAIIDRLFSAVDPLNVGAAKRASELSSSVGERLLLLHMKSVEERSRAKQIADDLNKSFFAHGDAVSRTRAKELNLKIAPEDKELEGLIWSAYLGLEGYMELRKPFNPFDYLLSDPAIAAILKPCAPLVLPANAPPPLIDQIWKNVAQQAIQNLAGAGAEVEYSVVNAVVESPRAASEVRTKGRLSACRLTGGNIQVSGTDTEACWRKVEILADAASISPVVSSIGQQTGGAK